MNEIKVVRIYDHEQPAGYRILVDRLWPRGMSKVKAHLDEWDKEIGPTNELRKWFNHEDDKYPEFKSKYIAQLKANPATPAFIKNVKEKLEIVLVDHMDQVLEHALVKDGEKNEN